MCESMDGSEAKGRSGTFPIKYEYQIFVCKVYEGKLWFDPHSKVQVS